jgi:hypothetical protein
LVVVEARDLLLGPITEIQVDLVVVQFRQAPRVV